MTAIAPDVARNTLGCLDFELEIPCEVEFQSPTCRNRRQPGQWIVHFVCCHTPTVFCDPCLQFKMRVDSAECTGCEVVYTPSSTAYNLIEPLNKGRG